MSYSYKKILWQCRRGLWELDLILINFVENSFDDLTEREIESFQKLLSLEDVDLLNIFVHKVIPEEKDISALCEKILFQTTKNV